MEWSELILLIVKLIGTIAFAVSGVMVAIEKQLDIFGAMVLGVITALGGGVLRDILLGINPPLMFKEYLFVAVAFATSFLVFLNEYFMGRTFVRYRNYYLKVINIFDAVGLGVFTVVGVNTAILYGHGDNWFLVVFIGTATGITGGVLRDVLAGLIPMVLRKQIYALASICGAVFFYILYDLGINTPLAMFYGAATVMLIRFLATHFEWSLPKVPR
jgi:uncharacterized membrane protein YeiH